jgi:hypothetical protein
MRVIDNGDRNPIIVLEPDDVAAWLRQKADEAGYSDRAASAVQVTFDFDDEKVQYFVTPELAIMVSNIPNSRTT